MNKKEDNRDINAFLKSAKIASMIPKIPPHLVSCGIKANALIPDNKFVMANIMPTINIAPSIIATAQITFNALQPYLQLSESLQHIFEIQNITQNSLNSYIKQHHAFLFSENWFPGIGMYDDSDWLLYRDISTIVATSKEGGSKRCSLRLNKLIFNYFSKAKIRKMEKIWQKSDIDEHQKKILKQAIRAYKRKEYALAICSMVPMWEYILRMKSRQNRISYKKQKEILNSLIKENFLRGINYDFFTNNVWADCNSEKDVNTDIPGRHAFVHGWFKEYPSKKSALNALIITDFLINLAPSRNTNVSTQ